MWQRMVIQYDPITRTLKVDENDFTTFEALGILEAVKVMIADHWMGENDADTV